MRPITLDGFERTFAAADDPWRTYSDRDEAVKRGAILHALGPGPWGRVLELAAGNGSNSVAIAPRARRLDATEGTAAGTALAARAIADHAPRARAIRLAVPDRFPRARYDAVVVAELLYYLSPRALRATAAETGRALRDGGMLVLAHHRIDFHDFAQHSRWLHRDFLAASGCGWDVRRVAGNRRWVVLACRKLGARTA